MINQLLNALTCEPNDTLAWLALADALEEAGESERAELTRLRTNPESQKRVQELLLSGVKPCVPTFTNSIGMELALIPAGKFMMGSFGNGKCQFNDETQHEVEITKPFWMGIYPMTQEEYEAVMGINPSYLKGKRLPVETVSWNDAVEFCKRLSKRPGERVYRLPTEAEWEYACRAGTTTAYNLGDDEDGLDEAGWYYVNSERRMHKVGEKKPNACGLYDMHGNVWELCSDWYDIYPEGTQRDPSGPANGSRKVIRGGCCLSTSIRCHVSYRSSIDLDACNDSIGFRVVSPID